MRKDIFPKISTISKAGFLSLNMMYVNAMNKNAFNLKKEKNFFKKKEENDFFNSINNRIYFKNNNNKPSNIINYKYEDLIKTGDFKNCFKVSKDETDKIKKEIQKGLKNAEKLRESACNLDKNDKDYKQKRDNIVKKMNENNKSLAKNINELDQKLQNMEDYRTSSLKEIKETRDFMEKYVKEIIKSNLETVDKIEEITQSNLETLDKIEEIIKSNLETVDKIEEIIQSNLETQDKIEEITQTKINLVHCLLLNIKSKHIFKIVLNFLTEKKKLDLIKYSKKLQRRICIDRNKEYLTYNFKITISDKDYNYIINKKEIDLGEYFDIERKDEKTLVLSNKDDIIKDYKFEKLNNSLKMLKDAKNLEVKIESPYNSFISCKDMFYCHKNITKIDISNFYTGNVKNFSHMFAHCVNLEEIVGLNNINTENAEDMSWMFAYCENLKKIDLSNFNTSKVKNMSYMFAHCKNLEEVKGFSDLEVGKVENISNLFNECESIGKIKFPKFINVTNMSSVFCNCTLLSKVDFNGMDFSTLGDYGANSMFAYCENLREISNYSKNKNEITYFSLDNVFGYTNSPTAEKYVKDFINIFAWES